MIYLENIENQNSEKKIKVIKFFDHIHQFFLFLGEDLSINLNIFNFLSSEVGLSVTITNEGLLDDALINPHDPSSNENLIPFTVKISFIS